MAQWGTRGRASSPPKSFLLVSFICSCARCICGMKIIEVTISTEDLIQFFMFRLKCRAWGICLPVRALCRVSHARAGQYACVLKTESARSGYKINLFPAQDYDEE